MEPLALLLLGLAVGFVAGVGVAGFLASRSRERAVALRVAERQQEHVAAFSAAQARAQGLEEQLLTTRQELATERRDSGDARVRSQAQVAQLQERLAQAAENVEAQRRLLAEAEKKLVESFKALSSDALSRNNQQFLELAKASFETLQKQAEGDLGKKQEAITLLLKPIGETLEKYEAQLQQIEVKRETAYSSLEQSLKMLGEGHAALQRETATLSTALRNPTVRGRWGEMTLERVAELAGMVEHCDFTTQETVDAEDRRQRPDLIVRLPGGRRIAVDSKVPLDAYLDAVSEGAAPEAQGAALKRHAGAFRTHLQALTSKAYWKALGSAPEFVVLFVPGEPFLSAALKLDPTLIEDGAAQRVLIATPTTLIATLLAVAHGWRQHQMAENAEEVRKLGAQLYERLTTFGKHFAAVGSRLDGTVEAYNKAVGSYDQRLAVTARRFQDLQVVVKEELPSVEPVDKSARSVGVQEPAAPTGKSGVPEASEGEGAGSAPPASVAEAGIPSRGRESLDETAEARESASPG